jgi:hypothetical protein
MHFHSDDIKAFLTKKVAGIPIGVFVLVFAGVVLFFAIRMKKSAPVSTADPTADESASGDGSNTDPTQQTDFTAPGSTTGSVTAATVTTTQTTDTNALWRTRAIQWAISTPIALPGGPVTGEKISIEGATASVDKYLNSEVMNANEKAIRDAIVAHFGFPPEGVPEGATDTGDISDDTGGNFSDPGDVSFNPPPNGSPTIQPSPTPVSIPIAQRPPTKQGTPPCVHVVVNGLDNSAAELAVLYHNSNSQDIVNKFHEVNLSTPGGPGGPWAPGTHVNIPSHTTPAYYKATSATNTAPEIGTKNGITGEQVKALNPGMNFPVRVGTSVRVK